MLLLHMRIRRYFNKICAKIQYKKQKTHNKIQYTNKTLYNKIQYKNKILHNKIQYTNKTLHNKIQYLDKTLHNKIQYTNTTLHNIYYIVVFDIILNLKRKEKKNYSRLDILLELHYDGLSHVEQELIVLPERMGSLPVLVRSALLDL